MVKNSVRNAYEQLIDAFRRAAEDGNVGSVRFAPPVAAWFRADGAATVVDAYLHLKDWRWRPQSKERVTIVVHVQETIREGQHLVRSTVRVGYVEVEGEQGTVMHSMHFDFGPLQACHPVFHAQLSGEPIQITDEYCRELRLDWTWNNTHAKCFKNARIPTADMSLASVLLCLAADHIGTQFFNEFRRRLIALEERLPQAEFDVLRESFRATSTHFRSVHWFSHM